MLFLSQEISAADKELPGSSSTPKASAANSAHPSSSNNIKEDEIDIFLSKQNGLIHRERDPQL